eukprot:9146632-Pyramimonas_sp.AAC.1
MRQQKAPPRLAQSWPRDLNSTSISVAVAKGGGGGGAATIGPSSGMATACRASKYERSMGTTSPAESWLKTLSALQR